MKQAVCAAILCLAAVVCDAQVASEADCKLVSDLYEKTIGKSKLGDVERVVHLVCRYDSDINSGVDFTQWLRWAEPGEISSTLDCLRTIGATNSHQICMRGIQEAFPTGVPKNKNEYSKRVDAIEFDKNLKEMRERLRAIAREQVNQNVDLTAKLAGWIRIKGTSSP